jgi:hypothetical protein
MNAKVVRLKRGYQLVSRDDVSPLTDDVPVPPPTAQRYPFSRMMAGQSFTCPADKLNSVKSALVKFRKGHPERQFTHRREGEDRIRVWRTK